MDEIARRLGLPERDVFPAEMPRYPNVWFFVPTASALRQEYWYALRLLDRLLDERLELRDSFHEDVRNPGLRRLIGSPGEGSDYQARIGPLSPWPGDGAGAPAHSHQLHARFVELLLHGTVRGVGAAWPDGRPAAYLGSLDGRPGAVFDEQVPGPYGCARLARILVGAGGASG